MPVTAAAAIVIAVVSVHRRNRVRPVGRAAARLRRTATLLQQIHVTNLAAYTELMALAQQPPPSAPYPIESTDQS